MTALSSDQVRTQLRRVLVSGGFANADRMRRFLEFVVEHTLSSPDKPLKEMTIGIELYARDFDPRISAVVRVDAARLRAKLREYYGSEGTADQLVIELPKGGYTPAFRESSNRSGSSSPATKSAEPSIAVLPFTNLSPEPEDYFSDGLTEEIIHALSSVQGLRVLARTSAFALRHENADVRKICRDLNVGFVLEGTVRRSKKSLRVTVQLVSASDLIAFARERLADYKTPEQIIFQPELPKSATGKIQRRALREALHSLAPQREPSPIF